MKLSKHGTRMAGFLAATRNEIATDEMFLKLVSLSPARVGYLPRVPKWITLGRKSPGLTKLCSLAGALLWIAGGAPLLFLRQYLQCRGRTPAVAAPAARGAGAVLALSSRTGDILAAPQFAHLPRLWITMPWAPLRGLPAGACAIDVHALLSRAELRACFVDALRATGLMLRRPSTRPWVLQSYTAFRWFCVRRAVDKLLPGHLVMTEHYDRWAILADDAVGARRRADRDASALTLVQHGSLGGLGGDGAQAAPALGLHRRLRSVTSLYAYGAAAERAFRAGILGPPHRLPGLRVTYFKPAIRLAARDAAAGLAILFVGHPLAEPLHVAVYGLLRQTRPFTAYYKPHPMAPMSDAMRHVGWTIVDDSGSFPAVDLLVSYESTLVVEYAGEGVPAEVHPINMPPERAGDYVERVRRRLPGHV
ncbi:hypothetical protein [Massilia glaciei]|nr:hypothetical protein [Massilia glaciei]